MNGAGGPGSCTAATVLAPLATGVLLLCAGLLAHGVLQRRRLAAWDAEWPATGPGRGSSAGSNWGLPPRTDSKRVSGWTRLSGVA